MSDEKVTFRHLSEDDYIFFDSLYQDYASCLQKDAPDADIQHIGATAVRGLLTKGDLDIVVRVPPAAFPSAKEKLSRKFAPNNGSTASNEFQSFCDKSKDTDIGIQLVVIGSENDMFHLLKPRLENNPAHINSFNETKKKNHNGSMEKYREEKHTIITKILEET